MTLCLAKGQAVYTKAIRSLPAQNSQLFAIKDPMLKQLNMKTHTICVLFVMYPAKIIGIKMTTSKTASKLAKKKKKKSKQTNENKQNKQTN